MIYLDRGNTLYYTRIKSSVTPKQVVAKSPSTSTGLPTTPIEGEEYKMNNYEDYTINTKSFLYDKPDASTKRKAYLVNGDVVGFVKKSGVFVYVYWRNQKTFLMKYNWVLFSTLNRGKSLE